MPNQQWQDGDRVSHPIEGEAIVRWSPDRTVMVLIFVVGDEVRSATQDWLEQDGWEKCLN